MNSPTITIAQGALRGAQEGGVDVFRAIPYAAAPIGDLRWRPPQPHAGWTGERDATMVGPAPIQPPIPAGGGPMGDLMGEMKAEITSEDCLHLTVRRPAGTTAGANLPVMVWLHGGGFQFGHGSQPLYDGPALVARGIVLVNVNYRLGALGFLAHPWLTAEDEHGSSGNYGALDAVASLQWVRDNITAFGGDPGRVTLFGESAGATIAAQVAGSPLATGLFHRVISQSGSSFGAPQGWKPFGNGAGDLSLADAEKAGAEILAGLGVASVEEARALPAERLLPAGRQTFYRSNTDGWFLPEPMYRLLQNGAYDRVPVLAGSNADEGSLFMPPGMPAAAYAASVGAWAPFTDQVLAAYPAEVPSSPCDLMRDGVFAWSNWIWARTQTGRGGAPVHVYNFAHRPPFPPGPGDRLGAVHAGELPYVFGKLDAPMMAWTDDDNALSDLMIGYWTAFAATGSPNREGLPHWPAYTADREESLHFTGGTAEAAPIAELDRIKVLDESFTARHTAGQDSSST